MIDPFAPTMTDEESYERFLERVASKCKSRYAPCGGCLQGSICDNAGGIEEQMDEQLDDEAREYWEDEE